MKMQWERTVHGREGERNEHNRKTTKWGPLGHTSQREARIYASLASRSWPVLVLSVSSSVGVPPVTLQCACTSPEGTDGLDGSLNSGPLPMKGVEDRRTVLHLGVGSFLLPGQSVPMRCQCAVVCLTHLAPGWSAAHPLLHNLPKPA